MTSLDVVLPGLNEEKDLADTVKTLSSFLSEHMDAYEWRVVIADNGSTDATPDIGRQLASECDRVSYLRLEQRGRGRALKHAWTQSGADVVAYMDMDLSTDLTALPALVGAVADDGYDVAIGSRLRRGAQVIGRSPTREFISRCYSLIFRSMFLTGFIDAQCGFKAVGRRVVNAGAAPGTGHRLVLRYRAPHPVRKERLQRQWRYPSVGSTTLTAGCALSAPHTRI